MTSDLKLALRQLLKAPGFSAIAIVTLALGIGANTAIFSAINTVLVKTLPYPQPERIVLLWGEDKTHDLHRGQVSATDIADYRARNHVFDEMSTYTDFRPVLTGAGEPERIFGAQVGDGFFDVMRAKPMLGRVFTAEEQVEGKDYVAVLSYALWHKRFADDPQIVGKTVTLSARPYTVIGVLPASVHSLPRGLLPAPAEFYRPVAEAPDEKERASRHLRAIARLRPGVTLTQAQSEMDLISRQLEREHPDTDSRAGIHLVTLREDLVSRVRPALLMLFGAVVFLLLIACANVGNLLLARSISRYREIAIRAALGASRARVIRQFLTESILLALAGGVLGVLGATWSIGVMQTFGARVVPLLSGVELDVRVLTFSFVVSILTGVVFGCAPALRASRVSLNETLNDAGRTPGAVSTRSPLRSVLVVTEIALAMVLLVAAGLLIKTVFRLNSVDPGFDPERVLTMNVSLPRARYPKEENWSAFYERMLQRIKALPAVEAAAVTSVLPVSENFDRRTIEIEGQPRPVSELSEVDSYVVTPDYLQAMSISLVRGRGLTFHDTADAPPAVLISESMARKYWAGEEAIGKRIRFENSEPVEKRPWRTVVGIVPDVKQYGLDTAGTMALYVPQLQMPQSNMTLVVRTRIEPGSMADAIRREILAIDPEQAVFNVATMKEIVADSISLRRLSMFLLAGFAALALLLAAIGIYGVLAQTVAQRTHEIGIRMALGAQMRDVLKLILGHGMALAGIGIVAGVLGALGVTRLIANLLFGVAATDPSTFLAISLLLGAVAFLACYLPARRAALVQPMEALRYE
ncbi:MAG: ABC transporter permease [Chthoniobacterales bacterium]